MFKKFLLLVVLSFSVLVLAACTPEEPVVRTFKADGVYTAFSTELTNGKGPQVTSVSVTVENDTITDFEIDCKQSAVSAKDENNVATKFAFNEKSKKELGFLYGMHNANNEAASYTKQDLTTEAGLNAYKAYLTAQGKKEWFEQANLIEAFFLTNGTTLTINESKVIQNISGVTIKDGGYSALAAKAVQQAKDGVTYVFTTSGSDVVWVKATVGADGKFTALELNTLQGKVTAGAFAWNPENKQQLSYRYGMHNSDNATASYTKQDLTTQAGMDAYKAYLTAQGKKEWFEQANILSDYVLVNGLTGVVVETTGTNVGKLNKTSSAQALSSVSIKVSSYYTVLEKLYNQF